ncbi:MAG: ABC transporter ATP-binding protein [Myxococcota bacterium]|nr:ABC transporter ATP-binding protein [Myxococcota bacterium]
MIHLSDVHKTYQDGGRDNPVLNGVDLRIETGEIVALMGPSGSGKSTLLNLVGAMDQDYRGEISVDGQNLQTLTDKALSRFRNRTVSFVFQQFHLLPHLPVLENVAMPSWFNPESVRTETVSRATDLLTRVGLGDRLQARPSQLSGGEKQRVAIARALLNRPRVLLADEPTGALDSEHGDQVLQLIESLSRDEDVTVVVVTHDQAVAQRCGRLLQITDGRVLESRGGGA